MKSKFHLSAPSASSSLKISAARLRARIAGRLSGTSTLSGSTREPFISPWSSLRLDLAKVPLTHYRE